VVQAKQHLHLLLLLLQPYVTAAVVHLTWLSNNQARAHTQHG